MVLQRVVLMQIILNMHDRPAETDLQLGNGLHITVQLGCRHCGEQSLAAESHLGMNTCTFVAVGLYLRNLQTFIKEVSACQCCCAAVRQGHRLNHGVGNRLFARMRVSRFAIDRGPHSRKTQPS